MAADIYLSRPTCVTAYGEGVPSIGKAADASFTPLSYLPDRKVARTLSKSAAYCLASINKHKEQISCTRSQNAHRRGLFTGAPAPYTSDKDSYFEPAAEARLSMRKTINVFGEIFDKAAPMTALIGLPNGVMCFGSSALDALGPHGTYVDRERSVHMALSAGIKNIRMGRLDQFVVAAHVDTGEKFFVDSLNEGILAVSGDTLPQKSVLGGFASHISPNADDFVGGPLAKVLSITPMAPVTESFQPEIVMVSSLSASLVGAVRSEYPCVPVIDVFNDLAHLGELSGVIEISLAAGLASTGEIKPDASGLVICGDVFGHVSYLAFQLIGESK